MGNSYQFHPDAEKEFKESVIWHENNRRKSGKEFAESVFSQIDKIQSSPESRSADEDGIRWTGVSKFPYHIFYLFKAPIIWILAIWHNSRRSDGWRKRKEDV